MLHIHHQSYGIKNNGGIVIPEIFKEIGLHVSLESNPDFYHKKFEVLTIDDSREIKEIHASKPFSAEAPRVFVIELHGITREAQNALLKVFEEPAPNNFFFLLVPSFDLLLPTLKSRLHVLDLKFTNKDDQPKKKESFLFLSLKEKMALVAALAENISDEKQVKYEALEFLNAVERELYVEYSKNNLSEKRASFASKFEVIAKAKTYLNDRAPSVKMLLEYVALSV